MSGGLPVPTRGYIGDLNAVDVNTSAWTCENWVDLYRLGAKKRRTNVELDGAAGERGYPGDVDATGALDLRWVVIGSHDQTNAPIADTQQGFEDNVELLLAAWYWPDGDDRGCILARIVTPKNRLIVVGVQVDDYNVTGDWEEGGLRLTVKIPTGPVAGLGRDDTESA